jgi:hypothetical protein
LPQLWLAFGERSRTHNHVDNTTWNKRSTKRSEVWSSNLVAHIWSSSNLWGSNVVESIPNLVICFGDWLSRISGWRGVSLVWVTTVLAQRWLVRAVKWCLIELKLCWGLCDSRIYILPNVFVRWTDYWNRRVCDFLLLWLLLSYLLLFDCGCYCWCHYNLMKELTLF